MPSSFSFLIGLVEVFLPIVDVFKTLKVIKQNQMWALDPEIQKIEQDLREIKKLVKALEVYEDARQH